MLHLSLSSCDDSSARISVLEEVFPNSTSARTATGSRYRGSCARMELPSSRTRRQHLGVPIGRFAYAKGLFFNMQDHALFCAPSYLGLANPPTIPEPEAERSVQKVSFEAIQGGPRLSRRLPRALQIHKEPRRQVGLRPSTRTTVPTTVHPTLLFYRKTPNPRHRKPRHSHIHADVQRLLWDVHPFITWSQPQRYSGPRMPAAMLREPVPDAGRSKHTILLQRSSILWPFTSLATNNPTSSRTLEIVHYRELTGSLHGLGWAPRRIKFYLLRVGRVESVWEPGGRHCGMSVHSEVRVVYLD